MLTEEGARVTGCSKPEALETLSTLIWSKSSKVRSSAFWGVVAAPSAQVICVLNNASAKTKPASGSAIRSDGSFGREGVLRSDADCSVRLGIRCDFSNRQTAMKEKATRPFCPKLFASGQ